MATADPLGVRSGAAAYLRCYPYDHWRMALHLYALEEHAECLGHHAPEIFLDNGVSCRSVRPQLRLLLARVSVGQISTVLIPGRWVFSLDDPTADSVMGFLRGCGADVVELPHRKQPPPPHQPHLVGSTRSPRPC